MQTVSQLLSNKGSLGSSSNKIFPLVVNEPDETTVIAVFSKQTLVLYADNGVTAVIEVSVEVLAGCREVLVGCREVLVGGVATSATANAWQRLV